ncbi:putative glutamyl-tRNA amidotransferase subunit A [Nemania abortiva]|nr:putative glutamyl-tRNA amidotransferase subunit A [Nemania abortiva]
MGLVPMKFDPPTADVQHLEALLRNGKVTSEDLVKQYLFMVQVYDKRLHAMIETTPEELLIQRARELDDERRIGPVKGPLHGIPVILKLIDSGAIIFGKSNMSEFANFRGSAHGHTDGWSAVGGQAQSAYVRGGFRDDDGEMGHSSPAGSSTGSAVAVSAGYAPISIGVETDGSLISPAGRAALYTIKPTMGLVPQEGIIPVTRLFDSAGPMAKSVYDIAILLDAISNHNESFVNNMRDGSWENLSVATLDPHVWKFPDSFIKPVAEADEQIYSDIADAYNVIKNKAKKFVENVALPTADSFYYGDENSLLTVLEADMKPQLNEYLKDFLEESKVRSLEEIIEFNKSHAEEELPPKHDSQDLFIQIQEQQQLAPEEYEKRVNHFRKISRDQGIDKILQEHNVDVILGPADSFITSFAAASGYPIACMPLSYLKFNGRPLALAALAGRNQDATLIKMMRAWEVTFPKREPPPLEILNQMT